MKTKLLSYCIILFFLRSIFGCHSVDHLRRKKRQAVNNNNDDVENTQVLREFFTNCLRGGVGDIWEWESIIDTSILDTSWYETTGSSNCSEANNDDTPECWTSRLTNYLNSSSFLMDPVMQCIDDYTDATSQGLARFSSDIFAGAIENSNIAPELCQVPPAEPYEPNSRSNRQYATCNQDQTQLPSNRRRLDFPSVFQFVQQHTICSSELQGCDSSNMETATQGDANVPRWPYRFEALIKQSSPLSSAIAFCNDQVFPLQSDWGAWSECSVTCGDGIRSRNRDQCSEPGCATFERQSCSQSTCPECMISMFSRRRCGSIGISREECLRMSCCFSQGSCYRARIAAPSQFEDPCKTDSQFSMGIDFRPSPPSPFSFLRNQFSISDNRIRSDCRGDGETCGSGFTDCSSCLRMGCCWNSQSMRCYLPFIIVEEIVQECEEGFENPPACTPVSNNTCVPPCTDPVSICVDNGEGHSCICLSDAVYVNGSCREDASNNTCVPPCTDPASICVDSEIGPFCVCRNNAIYVNGSCIEDVSNNTCVPPCTDPASICVDDDKGQFCTCLNNAIYVNGSCIEGCANDSLIFFPTELTLQIPDDGVPHGSTIIFTCPDGSNLANTCIGTDTWSNPAVLCPPPLRPSTSSSIDTSLTPL